MGFGLAGAPVAFTLLLEVLPASYRSTWGTLVELAWTAGTVFEAGVAWALLDNSGWRWLLLASVTPLGETLLQRYSFELFLWALLHSMLQLWEESPTISTVFEAGVALALLHTDGWRWLLLVSVAPLGTILKSVQLLLFSFAPCANFLLLSKRLRSRFVCSAAL